MQKRLRAGIVALCTSISVVGVPHAFAADEDGSDMSQCTVAIDPGHNSVAVEDFDPKTGVKMADYPNGKEDADNMDVAHNVQKTLESQGVKVVLLKEDVKDNVSYRERVDKAEKAGADVAISIHTTPGVNFNTVIAQKEGGYREGDGKDGSHKKVTFNAADTAKASQAFGKAVADERSKVEPNKAKFVTENDFGNRPGLWSGNMPILQLMSDKVPWVYNEFGAEQGGGADGITKEEKSKYSEGIANGLIKGLKEQGCGSHKDEDGDGKDKTAGDNKGNKDAQSATSSSEVAEPDSSDKNSEVNTATTSASDKRAKVEEEDSGAKDAKDAHGAPSTASDEEDRPTRDEHGNRIEWSTKVENGKTVVTKTVWVKADSAKQ